MPGIFISYRREDTGGYAGRLRAKLARRYGRSRVFMDIDSIPGGTPFRDRIRTALDSCDVAIVMVGRRWEASQPDNVDAPRRIEEEGDFVRLEVAAALSRDDVAVVPVMVEGAEIPDLPKDLAKLPELQDRKLRNTEWRADTARICRSIDEADRRWRRVGRGLREIARNPVVAALSLAAIAIAVVLLLEPAGSRPVGCDNLTVPHDARNRLSRAAKTRAAAIEGSVWYGACGHRAWALADFPDGRKEVFAQNGFHWTDLGAATPQNCSNIPGELRSEWGEEANC